MSVSLRASILVLAAVASSSVAPAQMIPAQVVPASMHAPEPLIAWDALSKLVTPILVEALPEAQPLITGGNEDASSAPQDAVEFTKRPGESLANMVARLRSSTPATRELDCLAGAIYFESKSESLTGQLAVGEVVANRAKSGRFASTYCGVVFQRGQFSFVRGGRMPSIPRSGAQWKTAVAIAAIVDAKLHATSASRALFFHATRVSPRWRATRVAAIGNHIFYR